MRLRYLLCGVLIVLTSFGYEEDFEKMLATKLAAYYENNVPLNLHLFFNQPEYAPGDTAFFSVTLVASQDLAIVKGRDIVHINLADNAGKIIYHQKILVTDGAGANQLIVPANLAPGIYTLEAHCNWMKNQSSDFFYYTNFIVSGSNQWIQSGKEELQFFPEGGNLVSDVTNKVVVTGSSGTSGKIYGDNNSEILSYTLNEHGFQSFYFKPEGHAQYYTKIGDRKIVLPEAHDGVAVVMALTKPEFPLRVTLQVPPDSEFKNEDLYFIVSSRGVIYNSATVSFRDRNTALLLVPQTSLPEGILMATLFKRDGTALTERLFSIQNRNSVDVRCTLKDECNVREKIEVKVKIADLNKIGTAAQFSCTVTNADLLPPENDLASLSETLLLRSDLSVNDECSLRKDMIDPDLDNFLITRKWERHSWQDVLTEKQPTYRHDADLHLSGMVTINNKPAPDSTLVTFLLQNSISVYSIYTDKNGHFDFPLLYFFDGQEEVLFKAEHRGKVIPEARVILSSDSVSAPCLQSASTAKSDPYFTFMQDKRRLDRSYTAEADGRQPLQLADNSNALFEEEIFEPDLSVNLDDYRIFPTMEETLREVVLLVQHRKHKGKSMVRVWFDEQNVFARGEPLYVIDGVVTDDTDYFMSLKPEQVQYVKVVHSADKLRSFGKMAANGIILVETKIPNNAQHVRRSIQTVSTIGINPELKFKNSDYTTPTLQASRAPNLRAAVYWNPQIKTDNNGEVEFSFFAPDNTGNFNLRIEGITTGGKPFSLSKNFAVKFKKENN
jgi:hypothetical protein